MNYLTLALEDDAFGLVTTTETIKNASIAWKIYMHEYEPANKEALVELQGLYAKLKMSDKENLKTMIMELTQLNKRLKKVDNKYEKDDIKLITHLFARLPEANVPVKVVIRNSGIVNMDLKQDQKLLVSLWKEL